MLITCDSDLVFTRGAQDREEREKWRKQQNMKQQRSQKNTLVKTMSIFAASFKGTRTEEAVKADELEHYVHLRERIAAIAVRLESG